MEKFLALPFSLLIFPFTLCFSLALSHPHTLKQLLLYYRLPLCECVRLVPNVRKCQWIVFCVFSLFRCRPSLLITSSYQSFALAFVLLKFMCSLFISCACEFCLQFCYFSLIKRNKTQWDELEENSVNVSDKTMMKWALVTYFSFITNAFFHHLCSHSRSFTLTDIRLLLEIQIIVNKSPAKSEHTGPADKKLFS